MKLFTRSLPVNPLPTTVAVVTLCLAAASGLRAQSQEAFELNNGTRYPASSVKPNPDGSFTASTEVGNTIQTVRFTAKDVRRATLAEPKELDEARTLLANNKPEKAIEILDQIDAALTPYQGLPESWWLRAAILRMDALSVMGRNRQAASIAEGGIITKLHPEGAALLQDFQQIVTAPGKAPGEKIKSLQSMSERMLDSWTSARIWLEIGNTQAFQGKIEDAVKAWLRVPVFFPAEHDLAARGTVLAARGLQQLERAQDGEKLLADYLADHADSPYKETMETEMAKLKPKPKNAAAPAATKQADQPTPAKPADAATEQPADAAQ